MAQPLLPSPHLSLGRILITVRVWAVIFSRRLIILPNLSRPLPACWQVKQVIG